MPGSHVPAEVVLASQSPRRRRLLGWLSLPFTSTAVDTPEELDTPLARDPAGLAAALAAEKAVAARAESHGMRGLLLCFDTLVVLDRAVLGKPADAADAWRMLRALSGRTHQVVTGVALLTPDLTKPRTFAVTTDVEMRELDDRAIEAWMAHGTFLGCAGAYNIPLCHLYAALTADAPLAAWLPAEPTAPIAACDAALGRRCELGPQVVAGGAP